MKIFPILLRGPGRRPQKEPVPFKELLPLKLKPSVSGKGNKNTNVCCLYEMSVMFACLSSNEFQQTPCNKEIQSFQNCYKTFTIDNAKRNEKETKGILTPGEKNMSAKQLNILLKRYPNF